MSAVVQSLLVELDAKTAKLDAALQQTKLKLASLSAASTQTGAVGAEMGVRFERGALRAAGALESMARSGSVAGGAAKTLLATGSEMAFMFGPGGALIGALGVATLAIVRLFTKARDESKQLAEETKKQLDDLQNRGDAAGLQARARELQAGRPSAGVDPATGFFRGGINDLQTRIVQEQQKLEAALRQRNVFLYNAANKALTELKAEMKPLVDERNDIMRRLLTPGPDVASPGSPVTITAKSGKQDAVDAKRLQEELDKEMLQGVSDRIQAQKAYYDATVNATNAALDQMAELEQKATDLIGRYTKTKTEQITSEFDEQIKAAQQAAREGVPGMEELVKKLEAGKEQALGIQAAIDHVNFLAKNVGMSVDKIANASESANDSGKKGLAIERERARAIGEAAQGALQLASAFGLLDESSARSLESIVQIAANMGPLHEALDSGASFSSIIGAALPVLGGVATLVSGFLAGGREAHEAALEFSKATDDWRATLRDFSTSITGRDPRGGAFTDNTDRFTKLVADTLETLARTLSKEGWSGQITGLAADGSNVKEVLASLREWREAVVSLHGAQSREAEQITATIAQLEKLNTAYELNQQAIKDQQAALDAQIDRDLDARELRAHGFDQEAAAMELWNQQVDEFAQRVKEGWNEEQLRRLGDIQTADRKRQADEAAAAAAEAAAKAAEEWAAQLKSWSDAVQHMQERLAEFTTHIADATESLAVRLLRAQGKTEEADRRAFELDQKREMRAAQQEAQKIQQEVTQNRASRNRAIYVDLGGGYAATVGGPSIAEAASLDAQYLYLIAMMQQAQDYMAQLAIVQAAEAAALAHGPTLPGASAAGQAQEIQHTIVSRATADQADRMVDELTTIRVALLEWLPKLAGYGPIAPPAVDWGGGFSGVTVSVINNFSGPIDANSAGAIGVKISDELIKAINQAIGRQIAAAAPLNGSSLVS